MFNNVVLDVFIGLVFIYLLYSLFITIVSEMIVTWMALRSRILRVAIEKMLNDGYHNRQQVKSLWNRMFGFIPRYFLKEFDDFKQSLAGKFYANPSIKYLSDNGGEKAYFFSQTKPSYISAAMFAETLIQILKDKGSGVTDLDKINFCIRFNTHHIEPSTLKTLRDTVENSGEDINLLKEKFKAWYNETMDRANGWYKRKLQLILFWLGFIVALIFNVDSIQMAKNLSKDKEARNEMVRMGIELAKDSSRYSDFLNTGDSLPAKAIIDSGYAHIKEDMKDANTALGLGWPFADFMKAGHTSFSQQDDTTLYNNLVELQTLFNPFNEISNALKNKIRNQKKIAYTLAKKNSTYKRDTTIFFLKQKYADVPALKRLTDTIKQTVSLIDTTANSLQILKAGLAEDSASLMTLEQQRKDGIKYINNYSQEKFSIIDSIDIDESAHEAIIYSRKPYTTLEKTGYVLSRLNPFSAHFWSFVFSLQFLGLFITALMLSLGAPFWFDLLKKLIAIRGAGVKPEEKKKNDTASAGKADIATGNTDADNLKETINPPATGGNAGTALDSFTQKTKNETGVIAVAQQYNQNTKADVLMVFGENAQVVQYLKDKYGAKEVLPNGFSIPVEYTTDDEIKAHTSMSGDEIFNQNSPSRSGTLGCLFQKEDSDLTYFISCWHVMKDNIKWDEKVSVATIIATGGKAIGQIQEGFLSHDTETGIDIGIASFINQDDASANPQFTITAQHREVTAFDALVSTPVKLCGKISKLKNAEIFLDKVNAHIKYPDGVIRLMNDVFSITAKDATTGRNAAPTEGGDSGAVVTDINGIPLGMIIGGNGNFSYAIKFSNLLKKDGPLKEYSFKI
ncbi:MAG: hypothetical protein ABJC98_08655 [Bacteroidota bacterium]